MKKILLAYSLPIAFVILSGVEGFSQSCSSLNIQWQSDFNGHTCGAFAPQTMTMIHDELNRSYVYVANKEGGLKVYDLASIPTPTLVATVAITSFGSMEAMNIDQEGNYVYLALGNHFDTLAAQGMAIIDVTNPASPSVTDYYTVPSSKGGAGAVAAEGNYAYLCAMGKGLVILDVSNKNNIQFVSQFIPSINYPPVSNPDPKKINARGLEVKNGIVYLCYDAGGIRIINCVNPLAPKETGRFCNPAMYLPFDRPKAYNNLVLDDTLLYAAVDYAGMEVLNIKDTSNISLLGWWNPANAPNANWFGANVHANEIKYEKNCKRVFMSTGKSDMIVVDVSNPALPDSCNFYGGIGNGIGTWGIGLWQNQIYLSYVCTLGIPFASNWTGVKLLTYSSCTTDMEELNENAIYIYPVPAQDKMIFTSPYNLNIASIKVVNTLGEIIACPFNQSANQCEVNLSGIAAGFYFLKINAGDKEFVKGFVKH